MWELLRIAGVVTIATMFGFVLIAFMVMVLYYLGNNPMFWLLIFAGVVSAFITYRQEREDD